MRILVCLAMFLFFLPIGAFGHSTLEDNTYYGDKCKHLTHPMGNTNLKEGGSFINFEIGDHSSLGMTGSGLYLGHAHCGLNGETTDGWVTNGGDAKPMQPTSPAKKAVSTPVMKIEETIHFVSEPEPPATTQQTIGRVPHRVSEPEPPATAQQTIGRVPHRVSEPAQQLPIIPPASVHLTEIMFRDFSRSGGGGRPQWIELYNAGRDTNLEGYTMVFHEQKHHRTREPIDDVVVIFGSFELQSGDVAIIAKKPASRFAISGVVADQVYINSEIRNLKHKWSLFDTNGELIYKRTYRWNWGIGGHNERIGRVPVDILPTAPPAEGVPHYYGSPTDSGTPGHHEEVVAAAPSLQKPKLIAIWAELKKQ